MMLFRPLFAEPGKGDILRYKLRSDQYPIEPDKIWLGTISRVLIDMSERSQPRFYLVQSIDCQGDAELVHPEQVIGYEKKPVL